MTSPSVRLAGVPPNPKETRAVPPERMTRDEVARFDNLLYVALLPGGLTSEEKDELNALVRKLKRAAGVE